MYVRTHIYIHTYVHTCMHTYIRTYMHTYIHTYRQTDRQTYIGITPGGGGAQPEQHQHTGVPDLHALRLVVGPPPPPLRPPFIQ